MDGEAWRAVVHGVAKSWTQLRDWTELNEITTVLGAILEGEWIMQMGLEPRAGPVPPRSRIWQVWFLRIC